MDSLFFMLLSIFFGAVGQVLLKVGANRLKFLSSLNLVSFILSIIKNPAIITGLIFFVTSFLMWIKVLIKKDLSYAYPMVSLGYVIVVILSVIVFKEAISLNKFIGIFLIILGVIIING